MTRIESLTSSREFERVASSGRRAVARTVSITVAPGAPQAPRVGVAASTRIGSAVKRNRAKRLLREGARALALPDGLDIVLSARPAIAGVPLRTVIEDLSAALARLGIAC